LTFLLPAAIGSLPVAEARPLKDFFQNSDLTNGANYLPAGTPTGDNDVVLTSPASAVTLNASNLTMGSVNQTVNVSRTVSNNAAGSTNSSISLGGGPGVNTFAPDPADLIYLGCPSCSLTLQGPNGDDGLGVLRLSFSGGGNLNVAQGATLNVSAALNFPVSAGIKKTGLGTLNISGPISALSSSFEVSEGIANYLSGAQSPPNVQLAVSNTNSSVGSAVVFNVGVPATFGGIRGDVVVPSSGTNTATVNLLGSATQLQLTFRNGQPSATYGGIIAGSGSVVLGGLAPKQTFTGNNTYTGTTTVPVGELVIAGTTTGQGSYVIGSSSATAILSGSGTIGLSSGSLVSLGAAGSRLAPGASGAIATLSVNASGAGGVSFGDRGTFEVHVGANGVSDKLAITGGSIVLSGSMDTLVLSALPGGFDGSDYTIATFPQNAGGGVFNVVQGLPSGYVVEYNATSIRLVAPQIPLQLTAAASRKMHGTEGAFDVNLLITEPVECRSSDGNHTLVFAFTNELVGGNASITTGIGTISGTPTISGKTMTVNLTGVADVQKIGVTLQNVTDRFGQVFPNTTLMINMLIGDTTGNRAVSASDIAQTKAASGSVTTANNFRQDVTANGVVSASDLAQVKSRAGFSIPE
jgi:autotransporter-associated beta strand protein